MSNAMQTIDDIRPATLFTERKRAGLTQSQFAGALGVSLRTYNYYEGGNKPIPLIFKMAFTGYLKSVYLE